MRYVLLAVVMIFAAPAVAQTVQTGTFVVTDTPSGVIGDEATAYATMTPVNARVRWTVHVPPAYDPARPPGIMVYISPSDSGDVPGGWDGVLDRDNLIWISAEDSGNDVEVRRRIYDVILALNLVRKRYTTDPQRAYLTGFSGGGRAASILMATAPYLFNGAIYICGGDFHKADTPETAARMMRNRYVFMTGGGDFNRYQIRAAHKAYVEAGADKAYLVDLRSLEHVLPAADDFASAVDLLDNSATAAPPQN